jgi:hypothetical protein
VQHYYDAATNKDSNDEELMEQVAMEQQQHQQQVHVSAKAQVTSHVDIHEDQSVTTTTTTVVTTVTTPPRPSFRSSSFALPLPSPETSRLGMLLEWKRVTSGGTPIKDKRGMMSPTLKKYMPQLNASLPATRDVEDKQVRTATVSNETNLVPVQSSVASMASIQSVLESLVADVIYAVAQEVLEEEEQQEEQEQEEQEQEEHKHTKEQPLEGVEEVAMVDAYHFSQDLLFIDPPTGVVSEEEEEENALCMPPNVQRTECTTLFELQQEEGEVVDDCQEDQQEDHPQEDFSEDVEDKENTPLSLLNHPVSLPLMVAEKEDYQMYLETLTTSALKNMATTSTGGEATQEETEETGEMEHTEDIENMER